MNKTIATRHLSSRQSNLARTKLWRSISQHPLWLALIQRLFGMFCAGNSNLAGTGWVSSHDRIQSPLVTENEENVLAVFSSFVYICLLDIIVE